MQWLSQIKVFYAERYNLHSEGMYFTSLSENDLLIIIQNSIPKYKYKTTTNVTKQN